MEAHDIKRLAVFAFHVGTGLFVVGVVAFELFRRGGLFRDRKQLLHLLAGALPFVISSVVVRWGPVHDHLAFVARGECAYRYLCEAMFPWSGSALDVFGAVQRLIPTDYSPWTIIAAGYVLELGVLVVGFAATRGLLLRTTLAPQADRGAMWSLFLLGTNLAYVRVATAGTVWSLLVFWMLSAIFLATHSGATSTQRVHRGAEYARLSAALLALVLAASGMAATLPLLLVLPIAVYAWSPTAPARSVSPLVLVAAVLTLVAAAALVALPAIKTLETVAETGAHQRNLKLVLTESTLVGWRHLSFATVLLAAAGSIMVAVRERRLVPVLVVFALSEVVLATEIRWDENYPTYYVHMHLSGALTAVLGSVGVAWLFERVNRQRRRGLVAAGLAATVIAGSCAADRARVFATESRVLDQEIREFVHALYRLPPHDCLVRPPLEPTREGPARGCDPVEVTFPETAYRAARRREGVERVCVVSHADLYEGRVDPDKRLLAYVGSSMVSWSSCSIAYGDVPEDTYHRRTLRTLDAAWVRTPAATWLQPTAQNPLVVQRLAADRVEAVELGFFFLERRPKEAVP